MWASCRAVVRPVEVYGGTERACERRWGETGRAGSREARELFAFDSAWDAEQPRTAR